MKRSGPLRRKTTLRRATPLRRSTAVLKRCAISRHPKHPAKIARAKAERAQVVIVRPLVETRDAPCRVGKIQRSDLFGVCRDRFEWAHLASHRRSKTVGREATARHNTTGSVGLCGRHHDDYDEHRLEINQLTERGADGPLKFERAGAVYIEDVVSESER